MFYLFIISSLNDPIYRKVHKKRRSLLRQYGIPYTVLVNHPESPLDDKTVPTLVPMLDDEVLYNGEGYNPYMAQKFLFAVKMYFRSFRTFEEVPNYIVRTNATTYIHYPSLIEKLESPDFPRKRVLAGPEWTGIFVQGMIMIFSKDVLANMLMDPHMYDKETMTHNDDVSLSFLSKPYCDWYYISEHLVMPHTDDGIYKLDEIKPRENKKWIFRIANHGGNRHAVDMKNWEILMDYYGEKDLSSEEEDHSAENTSCPAKPFPLYLILIIILVVFFVIIICASIVLSSQEQKK